MEKFNIFAWNVVRNFIITVGVGVEGISLILILFGTDYFPIYGIQWMASMGLAIMAIGVAAHSIVISKESDERVNSIANSNFLSVLSRFEDRRLDLQFVINKLEVKYPNIVIWKALVDIKEMKKLLEFCDIEEKHQKRMMNLQCQLLRIVNNNYHPLLKCEGVKHLLQISKVVLDLEYKFDDLRKELFNHIKELFDESEGVTVDEEYIKNIIPYLDDLSKESFTEMREQIKFWYCFS